jgi:hypothetical protein
MSKRLVKVAKELNVGTKTIVEFLNANGFSVSDKPTVKISDEMYDILAKNFQNSIVIKEKANQITIGTRKTSTPPSIRHARQQATGMWPSQAVPARSISICRRGSSTSSVST